MKVFLLYEMIPPYLIGAVILNESFPWFCVGRDRHCWKSGRARGTKHPDDRSERKAARSLGYYIFGPDMIVRPHSHVTNFIRSNY